MIKVKVHADGVVKTIELDRHANLLNGLRSNGIDVYAPCGGNGTCGKCTVHLKGEGKVTTCVHHVADDIEIVMPDSKEAKILADQYELTKPVAFDPGPAIDMAMLPHGVAIDLGTTSLVFHLINLITGAVVETRTALNPQAQYGGDVITRINFTSEHSNGLKELQNVITDAFNKQLDHFAEIAGITNDDIVKVTVSGNTTMLHLLLGVDPLPIALAPFTPAFTDTQRLIGKDLGLHCNEAAEIFVMPSISAYVGADIVAGIATLDPPEHVKNYLFLDIGTNGEMALVTPDKIYCCATAAGPAFEGANISCGMGALQGAISYYDQSEYKTIGDEHPEGICGSGLIDIVAHLISIDITDMNGTLDYDYVIAQKQDGTDIFISQQDVREVQLAKAAIAAGVTVLMKHSGLNHKSIDALYLAGGFGNYIRPESAIQIGLLAQEFKDKIIPVGNTSVTGALLALKSAGFEKELEGIRSKSEYIELSSIDDFTMEFAMQMMFDTSISID